MLCAAELSFEPRQFLAKLLREAAVTCRLRGDEGAAHLHTCCCGATAAFERVRQQIVIRGIARIQPYPLGKVNDGAPEVPLFCE